MKPCSKCAVSLPDAAFYLDRRRNQLKTICKSCVNAAAKAWNDKNPRAYVSVRKKPILSDEELRIRAIRRRNDKLRRHPEFIKAWAAVQWALKTGRLIRPSTCSLCSIPCKPDAHHDDHSKRLDVLWLCKHCHQQRHWEIKRRLTLVES